MTFIASFPPLPRPADPASFTPGLLQQVPEPLRLGSCETGGEESVCARSKPNICQEDSGKRCTARGTEEISGVCVRRGRATSVCLEAPPQPRFPSPLPHTQRPWPLRCQRVPDWKAGKTCSLTVQLVQPHPYYLQSYLCMCLTMWLQNEKRGRNQPGSWMLRVTPLTYFGLLCWDYSLPPPSPPPMPPVSVWQEDVSGMREREKVPPLGAALQLTQILCSVTQRKTRAPVFRSEPAVWTQAALPADTA